MGRKATAAFDAKAFLTKASTGRTGSAYRKKQVVFAQGDPADAVFYLERGQIKLTVVSDQGKSAVVALLGRGDFFGEGCLAGQPVRMPTASAVTDVSVVRVERQSMIQAAPRAVCGSACTAGPPAVSCSSLTTSRGPVVGAADPARSAL